MQKPQILWRNQTPSISSIKCGWNNLSQNGLLLLVTANLLWLAAGLYTCAKFNNMFHLISGLITQISLTLMQLHSMGHSKESLSSLIKELKIKDGTIWVGDYPLPDTVRKVVIGRIDIQGPAYLQLAWNQGHQWTFPLDELQQVRHFFRQHAPHIEIVNE